MRKSYIGLDLIRFCAAAMVMIYHLAYFLWLPRNSGPAEYSAAFAPLAPLADWGWVGVEIFFVISGFVIAFSAQGKGVRAFLVSRVARLYPAAWICATITALTLLAVGRPDWRGWLGSMALSPVGPWIDGVYWTLGIEMTFYAWVALVLWRFGSRGLLGLGFVLAAVSSSFWLLRAALLKLFGVHFDPYLGAWSYVLLLEYGALFALGIAIWAATGAGGWTRARLALAALSLPGCLIEIAAHIQSVAGDNGTAPHYSALAVWLVVTAAMAAAVSGNEALHARFGRYAPRLRTLGLATYPLYLVHQIVGRELMLRIGSPWPALVAAFVAMGLLAFAVVRLEAPLRRLIMRAAGARTTPSVPDSVGG